MGNTIVQIKAATDAAITSKTTIHSISPANVGNQINSITDALEQPLNVIPLDQSVIGTSETDVWTFDIPAGQFATDGDEVEVDLIYQTKHTVGSVIRLYLRTIEILEQDTSGDEGVIDQVYTHIKLRIIRMSADNLLYTISWENDTTNSGVVAYAFFGDRQISANWVAAITPLRLSFEDGSIGIRQVLNFARVTYHRAA
jgi:hypothetical protein